MKKEKINRPGNVNIATFLGKSLYVSVRKGRKDSERNIFSLVTINKSKRRNDSIEKFGTSSPESYFLYHFFHLIDI